MARMNQAFASRRQATGTFIKWLDFFDLVPTADRGHGLRAEAMGWRPTVDCGGEISANASWPSHLMPLALDVCR